ncbi:MAG: TolC family protein, partial [Desulfobacterales bacterium]
MIRHLLLIGLFVIFAATYANPAQVQDKNMSIGAADGPAESSGSKAGAVNRLSLSELIHRVVAQNQQIQSQKAQWDIKQAEGKGTHAIFEPDFVTSAEYEDNSKKNTPQESLNRLGEDVYTERNWDYNVGLEGLVPTGGKVNLGYELRQLSNSVTKDLTDEDDEYEMYLGLSVRQPLLKNAGIETTKTAIRVAQKESQVSFQEYRRE